MKIPNQFQIRVKYSNSSQLKYLETAGPKYLKEILLGYSIDQYATLRSKNNKFEFHSFETYPYLKEIRLNFIRKND